MCLICKTEIVTEPTTDGPYNDEMTRQGLSTERSTQEVLSDWWVPLILSHRNWSWGLCVGHEKASLPWAEAVQVLRSTSRQDLILYCYMSGFLKKRNHFPTSLPHSASQWHITAYYNVGLLKISSEGPTWLEGTLLLFPSFPSFCLECISNGWGVSRLLIMREGLKDFQRFSHKLIIQCRQSLTSRRLIAGWK